MEEPTVEVAPRPYSLQPRLYELVLLKVASACRVVLLVQSQDEEFRELVTALRFPSNREEVPFRLLVFGEKVREEVRRVALPTARHFTEFKIDVDGSGGQALLKCRVLNAPRQELAGSPVLTVRLAEAVDYDKFLEFRKKVKRLENLTSPLQWQLSHRVVLTQGSTTLKLQMAAGQPTPLPSPTSPLTLSLVELSSLGSDSHLEQTLCESSIPAGCGSCEVLVKFSQYLQLRLALESLVAEFKP